MKARLGAAALACLVAAALATPAGSSAKSGYVISPGYFSISAELPSSNGYGVYLGSVSHRLIEVVVYRRGENAYYLVRGKANRHGVDVDLGRFGEIHARFTGARLKSKPAFPGCRGRRPIEARGRLEGSFRFRGEDGYVTVATKRVRASYSHGFKEVCDVGVDRPRKPGIYEVLNAMGKSDGRTIRFNAFYGDRIGVPVISASTFERVGRVLAWKLSSSEGERSRLEFSPPEGQPQTVTVAPAFPFSGSATYVTRPDGSEEWSGDLRVSFAGLGEMALTGPGFQAAACRLRLSEGALECEDRR